MRRLNNFELNELADAILHLKNWKIVQNYVEQYYGSDAVVITIDTASEYNDEGGYDPYRSITVLNDRDEPVDPDFSKSGWKDKTIAYFESNSYEIEEILSLAQTHLPYVNDSFDLTVEPKLKFAAVFVEDIEK